MTTNNMAHDPLEFVRNMWGRMGFTLPGMVTPTLDVDELEKRIADMRAVEGWLKMNLSMLQMAIQGLDMQRAAIAAVHAMSQPMQAAQSGDQEADTASSNPFLWPWSMMSSMPEAEATSAASVPVAVDEAKPRAKRKVASRTK
ncbi:MAG: hypothetical protein LBV29_01795 [Azoarcus sp.]|nr:hypothetical protein [Azoarcus sp.]